MRILCYVLPCCIYDIILGQDFLAATQTMSAKHRNRITLCYFSIPYVFHMSYLGGVGEYLEGKLGHDTSDAQDIVAIPDTGAECNVIRRRYENRILTAYRNGLLTKRPLALRNSWDYSSLMVRSIAIISAMLTVASSKQLGERMAIGFSPLENG